jgi:hypothetical protein
MGARGTGLARRVGYATRAAAPPCRVERQCGRGIASAVLRRCPMMSRTDSMPGKPLSQFFLRPPSRGRKNRTTLRTWTVKSAAAGTASARGRPVWVPSPVRLAPAQKIPASPGSSRVNPLPPVSLRRKKHPLQPAIHFPSGSNGKSQ